MGSELRPPGQNDSIPSPQVNGCTPSAENVVKLLESWRDYLRKQGLGEHPHVVRDFVWNIERELRLRYPTIRLNHTHNAPRFDASTSTLLYIEWFKRNVIEV